MLGHELVHAFQFDMTGGGGATSSSNIPNAVRLPLWFIEGMAEYLSVGPVDPHTAMWMRDAARREQAAAPSDQLDDPDYFPYRYGQALWSYVAGRWGDEVVARRPAGGVRGSADAERILEAVTGLDHKELSKQWHEAVRDAYRPVFEAKRDAAHLRAGWSSRRRTRGELNVAPALSPDGSQARLPLGEGPLLDRPVPGRRRAPGSVRRKLDRDRGRSALREPAVHQLRRRLGRRRAGASCSAAIRKGQAGARPSSIPRAGAREREIPFARAGRDLRSQLRRRTGSQVVFSAIVGRPHRPLRLRPRGEARCGGSPTTPSPTCSRPGRRTAARIAFVTDRFSSRLDDLTAGNYRLAAMDPALGRHPPAAQLRGRQEHRPRVVRGRRAACSSSPTATGSRNVYRLDVASGAHVAGHRPRHRRQRHHRAQPVALRGPRPARLQRLRGGQAPHLRHRGRRGWPGGPLGRDRRPPARGHAAAARAQLGRGARPPRRRRPSACPPARLRDGGLQAEALPRLHRPADPHRGRATARGPSWAAACRSSSATCSATTPSAPSLQVNGQLRGLRRRRRLREPEAPLGLGRAAWSRSRTSPARFGQRGPIGNGQRHHRARRSSSAQTNRSAADLRRLSVQPRPARRAGGGGAQHRLQPRERRRGSSSASPASSWPRSSEDLPAPDGLTYGEASAALVYDTSVFGATSPILGQRYRLEVTPDLRRRSSSRACWPTTAATSCPCARSRSPSARLHYGRYGSGGEDDRALAAVHRLPEPRARLRRRLLRAPRECGTDPDASARSSTSSWGAASLVGNAGAALPALRRRSAAAANLYGPVPARARRLRRHRRGLDGGRASAKFLGGDGTRSVREQRRRGRAGQRLRVRDRRGRLREAAGPAAEGLALGVQLQPGVLIVPRARLRRNQRNDNGAALSGVESRECCARVSRSRFRLCRPSTVVRGAFERPRPGRR